MHIHKETDLINEKINDLEPYIQALPQCFISHSESVGEYVQAMVDKLFGLAELKDTAYIKLPMPEKAYLIGRYHDIGKAGISNAMWEKTSCFSDEEYKLAQTHTVIGAHFVMPRLSLNKFAEKSDIYAVIAESCMFHHERWDGSGYPFHLKGEQIPLYARIVALADCYDAMIEERPYKKQMSKEAALKEIQRQKGKQFDPVLTDIFCKVMQKIRI